VGLSLLKKGGVGKGEKTEALSPLASTSSPRSTLPCYNHGIAGLLHVMGI